MKKLLKIINIIGNIIILNIVFVLTSICSLTLCTGTSLSALYATFLDLKTDNSGYYFRNYFRHFKGNFKQTIIVDIVLYLLGIAAYFNLLMINSISNASVRLFVLAFWGLIVLELLIISSFIFPVISKFEGNLTHLLYLSFYFSHKYLYISLLFIIMAIIGVLAILYVSFAFVFIIFGLIGYIESKILKHIWKDYKYEILEI